jgi:hypothetical protein
MKNYSIMGIKEPKNRISYLIRQMVLFAFFVIFSGGLRAATLYRPVIFHSGEAEISLQDHLHHPFYWWPNTLLSYPIVFEENILGESLVLTDRKTGTEYPFQLTNMETTSEGKTKGVLSFFADLPSGGSFDYVLKKGNPGSYPHIKVEQKNGELFVQTDKLSVWIPSSRSGEASFLPGPVLGVSQVGNPRMGNSIFQAGKRKLEKLETRVVSDGSLFAEINVSYFFTDGATYRANICCIKGYDFVEIKEQMNGFSDNEESDWEIDWSGFSPTHRQAPNHPHFFRGGLPENETPGFGRFDWETIDQKMLSGHLGIIYAKDSTRIPFEINTYGNYPAEKTVTSSVFWDEKSKQSVGIFMNNALEWDDREYAIWHITGRLSVRFYYRSGQLLWKYPVVNGTRSTALSCYNHQKDIDYMNNLEQEYQPHQHPDGFTYRVCMSQLSYNTFLQNRYGTIHLNEVKDWDLAYPDSLPQGPVIFPKGRINSVKDLERNFLYGSFILELPFSGTCQNSGYGPTSNRQFYDSWVDAFDRLLPAMLPPDRERFISMFLFHAYVAADEEYMPMRNMLSGHPNFLADVKSTPAMAAFLFPRHPAARDWEELFGKYIELNTHYHTRPNVKSWDATGGRWTENLGTYVWGFLRPTLRSNYLLQNYTDGINHLASDNTAILGSWLLNTLSAPFQGESLGFYTKDGHNLDMHYWGLVTKDKGQRRVHSPQGAHSARRMPSASLWLLGQELKNYDPLLSENISFVSHPDDQEEEVLDRDKDPFAIMYPEKGYDPGTPPDFKSIKFTGYGITLRAAVGTKDELSIHLQQIDRGPNYRWGLAADGGCGNIYFYAGGKSYSHNGKEDSGDRRVQDTDLITNFGVFKDGRFKSVGMNVLEKPMYDLGTGQFAEIVPSQKYPYSWPEYQGRSIMLVGSDYFILYDDVHDNNIADRLSWFTHPEEDFPEIKIIKAGGIGTYSSNGKVDKTEIFGKESKGVWYDGSGDFMTFVSHKKGYQAKQTSFGGIITSPQGQKDYVFRNDTPVEVHEEDIVFSGTAGFIREKEEGKKELALFHGTLIGSSGVEISTNNSDCGISAVIGTGNEISGRYFCARESKIEFSRVNGLLAGVEFYLDGVKQPVKIAEDKLIVSFPSGEHLWNLTSGLPDLVRPEIDFTRNEKGKVILGIHAVSGANLYRFEYSTDVGKTWTKLKDQSSVTIKIGSSKGELKGYVRSVALNKTHESQPSVIYPVYFTSEKPHYPDGLRLNIETGKFDLTWGRVLGCTQYRLYRRIKGSAKFQMIYRGEDSSFSDQSIHPDTIYEYAVTTVNGNGESNRSNSVNTNPSSWLNFDPMPGEPFRRSVNLYDGSRDNSGTPVDLYYPE